MRQNAESVLDEFLLGATQFCEPLLAVAELDLADLAVEQLEERTEAVFEPGQFEL